MRNRVSEQTNHRSHLEKESDTMTVCLDTFTATIPLTKTSLIFVRWDQIGNRWWQHVAFHFSANIFQCLHFWLTNCDALGGSLMRTARFETSFSINHLLWDQIKWVLSSILIVRRCLTLWWVGIHPPTSRMDLLLLSLHQSDQSRFAFPKTLETAVSGWD